MKIIIRKGIIENSLPEGFVITDTNVAKLYKNLMGKDKFTIKAGENSKSIKTYCKILEKLNDTNTIIAFGGGVVGDLAGFAASTYKRGINLIHVPTTLLAMVDSSIGGKNGVNLGDKKNYVGTIYQPKQILIDPLFLKTLPEKEFKNGAAEIIKYSCLFGMPSLERLQAGISKDDKDIEQIIRLCCKNKMEVVGKDEFDKGYRHVLNFGHTIGHAIELLCNLSHGEAISIGMVKELEIGNKLGIIRKESILRLKKALKANNLPTELPKNTKNKKILELIRHDKKGNFIFALTKDKYNVRIPEDLVESIL